MSDKSSELIYAQLPIFLQNCATSYYGWKLTRKRYNSYFYTHLESLKKSEWWSADQISAFQDLQIQQLLKFANDTVPFYRKWFADQNINPADIRSSEELSQLSVLTKDVVRKNQHLMISSLVDQNSLIKESTSGTTGTPLTVAFTKQGLAFQWAIWWRHKSRFGLTPNDRHLSFGGKAIVPRKQKYPPYWRHDYFGNRVYISVYHISPNTIQDIVNYLNNNRFVFFTGAASGMYALSSAIEEAGLTLTNQPKVVVCGADVSLTSYTRSFKKNFGAPVTDQYGMSEFAGNMSQCEYGRFHVDFECCYVETVPIEGTDYSKLLLTGWGNQAMPFIRYQVGDFAKRLSTPCPCGRQSICFESIDGRLEDYVLTPDGRKLMGMNQVLQVAENAKEIQIYQENIENIEFRIVPDKGFGESDKKALAYEFGKRAGTEMKVDFRIVDSLDRGRSGKLRAVISQPARERQSTEATTKN